MVDKKAIVVKQDTSPAEMIKLAVSGGADLEKLEKLLTLQERYEANEARKAYHVSMAEFKANPPEIDKDKTVKYKEVKYNHASLANVVKKITAELSKYGLSASWRTQQNGQIIVTCKITHVLGHSEETSLSALADTTGSKNSIQAIGSTISYLERYTLLAVLGLATHDTDDDGASADAERITEEQLGILRDDLISLGIEGKAQPFLKFMGVDKTEDILKSDFPKAKAALDAKKAKVKK